MVLFMIEYKIPNTDRFKDIFGVVDDAIAFAKEINDSVFFVFNKSYVNVHPQSFSGDIIEKYLLGVTLQYFRNKYECFE